jgi:hypothetical protein
MKKLLSLLILLSLVGCVRYYKPGAGQAEFNADSAFCEMNAYKFAPPAVERLVIRGAYQEPTQTNCLGNINMQENGTASRGTYYGNTNGTITNNCTTTGGNYVPPATVDIDNNQSARNAAYKNCLFQKGWSTVKSAEVKQVETTQSEQTRKIQNNESYLAAKNYSCNAKTEISGIGAALIPKTFNIAINDSGLVRTYPSTGLVVRVNLKDKNFNSLEQAYEYKGLSGTAEQFKHGNKNSTITFFSSNSKVKVIWSFFDNNKNENLQEWIGYCY